MKLETYIAKYYDVHIQTNQDLRDAHIEVEDGQEHVEIYERGEDCEPIGWFVRLPGKATYEWRNIYGKVKSGTIYTEAEAKQAVKALAFY